MFEEMREIFRAEHQSGGIVSVSTLGITADAHVLWRHHIDCSNGGYITSVWKGSAVDFLAACRKAGIRESWVGGPCVLPLSGSRIETRLKGLGEELGEPIVAVSDSKFQMSVEEIDQMIMAIDNATR